MQNASRILVLIFFLSGLVGVAVTGAAVYVRMVYLGATVIILSGFWTLISLRGVSVSRLARSLRANVGDIFEEYFEVDNTSRIMRLWIEVSNRSEIPFAAGSRILTRIGGREKRSYSARTWLIKRGAYPLGPTVISSGDPFGIFRRSREFASTESLLVLPKITPIEQFPAIAGLLPGGKAIREKSQDITPHASGVREYVTGDPLKRIHWASTARKDALMVKEFERDPQQQIWIFLDVYKPIQYELPYTPPEVPDWLFGRHPDIKVPPSSLEYGVSISASLAHYFLNQRRAVGFVSAGQVFTVIQADRSERQEFKILETLAFVKGDGNMPLAALVDAELMQMSSGSSAILITSSTNPDTLLAARNLQRRNLHPTVILLDAESFGGPKGSAELMRTLQENGVAVCPVSCQDNIAAALEAFASQNSFQESRLWQKPQYIPSI